MCNLEVLIWVMFAPLALALPLRSSHKAIRDPCPSFLAREWHTRPEKSQLLFSQTSELGAFLVNVTAHPVLGREAAHLVLVDKQEEATSTWTVLRFDGGGVGSFQSVSRTIAFPEQSLRKAQPNCLPFEYTRSIMSLVAALIGLQNQAEAALIQPVSAVPQSGRVLFIGLGGGSMPLFLSHAFPGLAIDITEIDATVIKAASEIIGFPLDRPGMQVHHRNAAAFMATARITGTQYDFIIFDAVTGNNRLPADLLSSGFLEDLANVLHPAHGSFLMNMHGNAETMTRGLLPPAQPFDPQSAAGQQIVQVSSKFRSALLPGRASSAGMGTAFIVRAMHQANVALTITRGLHLTGSLSRIATLLHSAAEEVGKQSKFPFPAGVRAQNRLLLLPDTGNKTAATMQTV